MESLQPKEESKMVNPFLTQEGTKAVNPRHQGYIVLHVENAPNMDLVFKGAIRIVYDDKNKELVIMVQDEQS